MAVSIRSSFEICRKSFNSFLEEVQDSQLQDTGDIHVKTWQDELGRLRMWAANIGAHKTGQSSLDFRLRDSSHIWNQIIKLLDEIPRRLQDVSRVITDGGDEDEDVESLDAEIAEGQTGPTEIQQLLESVKSVIDCLFELSMVVRKPAKVDFRTRSIESNLNFFAIHDLNYIRDKFPKADQALVARLGHATTRRRNYLNYRERHAKKLEQGIDRETVDQSGSEVLSEIMVTNVGEWDLPPNDTTSEAGSSVTSYTATLLHGGCLTVPNAPDASQGGKPFECPYCYFLITVKNTPAWHAHVFSDLQPYVCTEIMCTTPDKLHTTNREWLDHLRIEHPPAKPLRSDTSIQTHLDASTCALCKEDLPTSGSRRERHLARHLQEVALFILPRTDDESDDDDQNDDLSLDSHCSLSAVEHRVDLQIVNGLDGSTHQISMGEILRALSIQSDSQLASLQSSNSEGKRQLAKHKEKNKPQVSPKAVEPEPIRFKDAVGRTFSFRFNSCKTWEVSFSKTNDNEIKKSYMPDVHIGGK
ncbi:MAG: hypothetical protein Q9222_002996 [Ikaeria aurantiellina]